MNYVTKILRITLAVMLSMFVFTACEDSSHDGGGKSSGSVLPGTWHLAGADGSSWYIHFGEDGNWKITNDAAGAERRVYGTYSASGSSYKGDMNNPGVGTGTISGNILNDKEIDLDFCEHWHTPYKHVAYKGTKQ